MFTRAGAFLGLGSVLIALIDGGTSNMYDTVLNVVRKAEIVAYARVEKTSKVTISGTAFLRVEAESVEVLKGSSGKYTIDIHDAGMETPEILEHQEYLFILRPFEAGQPSRLRTVEMTRPMRTAGNLRPKFTACLREYVRLASRPPNEEETKALIWQMLESGITFFETDAAMTAAGTSHWTPGDLERLARLIEQKPSDLQETARENLATIVAKFAEPDFLVAFAGREFAAGHTDPIYYGILARPAPLQEQVLRRLFEHREMAIRSGALRVAGLLRNSALIDAFEREAGLKPDQAMRKAILKARELVKRDQ